MRAALLFLALTSSFLFAQSSAHSTSASPQNNTAGPSHNSTAERFWLAGRYDGNRVIVYFDTVKFGAPIPADISHSLTGPVSGFFPPVELPQSYLARFENASGAERFALGDEYDLLLGDGMTATIRLTSLVGFENDEETGNDSYIGALGTIEGNSYVLSSRNDYVVRPHQPSKPVKPQAQIAESIAAARLIDDPVSFETEIQIAGLMTEQMKVQATTQQQSSAAVGKLYLRVQSFHTAGGRLHYYAEAAWKTSKEDGNHPPYALGAWLVAEPMLRVAAVEPRTTEYGDWGLPDLLNVVDLDNGRTGAIFEVQGNDGSETELVEYRDGANLKQMHRYQSIGIGE